MSFSVNLENESKRPRVVKFAANGLDFKSDIPDVPVPLALPNEPQEDRLSKTMGTSIVLHTLLLAGIAFSTIPLIEKPVVETITIEIADSTGITAAPKGSSVPDSLGAKTMSAPVAAAAPAKTDSRDDSAVIQVKPRVAKAAAPRPKAAAARTSPKPAAKTTVSQTQVFKAPAPLELPENLDDVDAPDLDDTALKAVKVGPIDDRAWKDQSNKNLARQKELDRMAKTLENDMDSMSQENADAMANLEQEANDEAARLAAYQEGLRQKNADAVASARAAAEKAAQGRGGSGASVGASKGLADAGTGGGSKGAASGAPVGIPGGVRRLEDLRQMPGNPHPAYSQEERFAKQQGTVAYFAYVSSAGVPTQFKQIRTTGYSNLDSKTLAALKKWRFYPGQEGWVEIPFLWDLRGGPQELSALSRRNVGDNRPQGALRAAPRN